MKLHYLLPITLLATPVLAHANEAGDHVVHAGALMLFPDGDPNDLYADTPFGDIKTPYQAEVASATTLGLGYDYYVTDNVAVGIQVGIPPKHDVVSTHNGAVVGDVTQISPELKAKYVFGKPEDKVRPYLGGGISYVAFDGEIKDPAFKALLGEKVELDSGFAPIATAGVQINAAENIIIGASVSYMHLGTKVEFPDANIPGAKSVFTNVDLNPVIGYLHVGYAF